MGLEFNKAVVALVMAALIIIEQIWGFDFPHVSEAGITMILAILSPLLVWAIPNRPAGHA